MYQLYFHLIKYLNFFIFFTLVSQLYFCSIECLNFFYFFYFDVLILFLFNQVFKFLIFVKSSVSRPIKTYKNI